MDINKTMCNTKKIQNHIVWKKTKSNGGLDFVQMLPLKMMSLSLELLDNW